MALDQPERNPRLIHVWPFAKLLNGFSSHRYLYSPILFDSQVVSELFSTRTSTPGDVPCAADSIYLLLVGLWQWNGEWRCKPEFPGCMCSCGSIITMPLGLGLAMEMENGGGVRGSPTSYLVPQEAQPCIGVVFGD